MRSSAELAVACAELHAVCELKKLKALLSSSVVLPLMMGTRVKLYFSRASTFWHQSDDKLFVSLIFGYCVMWDSFADCALHWHTKSVTVGLTPSLLLYRHEYLSKVMHTVYARLAPNYYTTRTTGYSLSFLDTSPDQRNRLWMRPFWFFVRGPGNSMKRLPTNCKLARMHRNTRLCVHEACRA